MALDGSIVVSIFLTAPRSIFMLLYGAEATITLSNARATRVANFFKFDHRNFFYF